jgi:hypothetical protein
MMETVGEPFSSRSFLPFVFGLERGHLLHIYFTANNNRHVAFAVYYFHTPATTSAFPGQAFIPSHCQAMKFKRYH